MKLINKKLDWLLILLYILAACCLGYSYYNLIKTTLEQSITVKIANDEHKSSWTEYSATLPIIIKTNGYTTFTDNKGKVISIKGYVVVKENNL